MKRFLVTLALAATAGALGGCGSLHGDGGGQTVPPPPTIAGG